MHWNDLDIRRLRRVPDPFWLKAVTWAFFPFVVLAVVLDAGDAIWLGLFAIALALALVQFWLRSRRLKRTDRS